ncbi:hypothetical protein KKD49_01865 [Myxococcota bacterium]|nr:hypothetical protein [Myxococcota bacterium]
MSESEIILCGSCHLYEKYSEVKDILSSVTCWDEATLYDTHMELHSQNRDQYIPIPAMHLKYRNINCEYLWSAFTSGVSHLTLMEKHNFRMEKLTAEDVFLLKDFSAAGNTSLVFAPTLSEEFISNQENLAALSDVFNSMSPLFSGDRNEDSFQHLLNKAQNTELNEFYNFIKDIKRLHSYKYSKTPEKNKKQYLKNTIMWVIPILFIISLGISWLSGSKSGEKKAPPVVEKELENPPPVNEIKVSKSERRWDHTFYFNQIDLSSDSYLYINSELEENCYPGLFITFINQLKLNSVSCKTHGECVIESTFNKKSWTSKMIRVMALENNQWKVVSGKKPVKSSLADSAPSGEFGKMLNLVNYNPLSHTNDLIIFYSRIPDLIPPQNTIINPVLGGILPQVIASRVFVQKNRIILQNAARFASETDARACLTNAMTYLSAFLSESSFSTIVSGKNVLLTIKLPSKCAEK